MVITADIDVTGTEPQHLELSWQSIKWAISLMTVLIERRCDAHILFK